MKIKNEEIELILKGLNATANLKTGFKVAQAVAKNSRLLETSLKDFQLAKKNIIEASCIIENDKPKVVEDKYLFEDGVEEKVIAEIVKLASLEVDVELMIVEEKHFENVEGITPFIAYALEKMIK